MRFISNSEYILYFEYILDCDYISEYENISDCNYVSDSDSMSKLTKIIGPGTSIKKVLINLVITIYLLIHLLNILFIYLSYAYFVIS